MSKRSVECKYWIGDILYLRVADSPLRGMVTQVMFSSGSISYNICWGDKASTWHYEQELTVEYVPDFAGD